MNKPEGGYISSDTKHVCKSAEEKARFLKMEEYLDFLVQFWEIFADSNQQVREKIIIPNPKL